MLQKVSFKHNLPWKGLFMSAHYEMFMVLLCFNQTLVSRVSELKDWQSYMNKDNELI